MTRLELTGTRALVVAALRRDRVLVTLGGLVLVSVAYASAAATSSLYPTVADRVAAAEAINGSPAVVALYGPVLDVHSLGELAMTKMTVLYAVFVAALIVVLVRRHTRGEEEAGRTELLGGTGVGRDAPLAAAVLEALLVASAIGLLTAALNVVGGLPVTGSLAFGASWTGVGLVGAGVSAVACQLSASSRTCGAVAAGTLGLAYLVRAVGDASDSWVSWTSPFGWGTRLRAYSEVRWWVLGLYLALALCLVVAAQVLRARRDLGSGLLPARPGPVVGSRALVGPYSLSWRLHAPALAVWTAASAVMGGVLGAVVPDVSNLLDSASARAMMTRLGGEGAVERTLVSAELSIVAVAVACFGIAAFAHTATDEESGRTELVLASGTSRTRAFLAAALVAFAGVLWLLTVTGVALGVGYGLAGDGVGAALGETLPAALVQVPAAWVAVSIAAAAFSLRASWTVAAWAAIAGFVTVGQVGELADLPAWTTGLSPFSHTPTLPAGTFDAVPVLALLAVTATLLGGAWLRYSRRDIA